MAQAERLPEDERKKIKLVFPRGPHYSGFQLDNEWAILSSSSLCPIKFDVPEFVLKFVREWRNLNPSVVRKMASQASRAESKKIAQEIQSMFSDVLRVFRPGGSWLHVALRDPSLHEHLNELFKVAPPSVNTFMAAITGCAPENVAYASFALDGLGSGSEEPPSDYRDFTSRVQKIILRHNIPLTEERISLPALSRKM